MPGERYDARSPIVMRPRFPSILLGAFVVALAALPIHAQVRVEFTEVHMGVPVRLVLHAGSENAARAAARAAFARIAELDEKMSDYRPESEVRRLESRAGTWSDVSVELLSVLAIAQRVSEASGGAFDPTVGPLVALWRDARRSGTMPPARALDSARARAGWRHLEIDTVRRAVRLGLQGMRLDLGGIAKGFILQEAMHVLRAHGVPCALVEAGGDIVAGDAPPGRDGWSIAWAGNDAEVARAVQSLANAAVSTSGATAQFVEIGGVRYSHVVDPRTGLGLASGYTATVIARDGATADALATALSVLGPAHVSRLVEHFPGVVATVHQEPRRARLP